VSNTRTHARTDTPAPAPDEMFDAHSQSLYGAAPPAAVVDNAALPPSTLAVEYGIAPPSVRYEAASAPM
jgi:hypothetical protein